MEDRLLGIYLNDHFAGSTIGRELVRRAEAGNAGTEFGPFLARLRQEIDEDRNSLAAVMRSVGVKPNRAKQGAAFVGERLGRLKLNGRLRGYSPLSRLVELEGLTLGVHGKLACWRTVAAVAPGDTRLRSFDFEALIERANRQLEELEEHRRQAGALL